MGTSPRAEHLWHIPRSVPWGSASNSLTPPHRVTSEGKWRGEMWPHTCAISECSGISNSSICCSCACVIKASLMSSEVQRSSGTGITWEGGQFHKRRRDHPFAESHQSITGARGLLSTAQPHHTRQVSTHLYRLKLMRLFFLLELDRELKTQSLKVLSTASSFLISVVVLLQLWYTYRPATRRNHQNKP